MEKYKSPAEGGYRVDVRMLRVCVSRMCIGLDWDKDGEVLAILRANCSIVFLWDVNTKKLMEVLARSTC